MCYPLLSSPLLSALLLWFQAVERVEMEIHSGRGRSRETSPDRARVHMQPRLRPFRKVQIIYYLCRNGQLEHPHYMEVSHLPNQQLRLKDVMDRLTLLRGRGMPSLYSWSCKRSYKNGYVWNDLAENDVIHPADGAEYILKGSEIMEGCTERFQHLQLSTRRPKPISVASQPGHHRHEHHLHEEQEEAEEMEEEEEEEEEEEAGDDNIEQEEVEDKGPHNPSSSSSNTPNSRCSRGVTTEELDLTHHHPTHIRLGHGTSPPSSSFSDQPMASKPTSAGSARLDDSNQLGPVTKTPSILLQLIACGSVAMKGRFVLPMKNSSSCTTPCPASNHGDLGNSGRKSGVSLHRGVLCRLAESRAVEDDGNEEEKNVINYMSENPRFGNPQLEEKEYFSGSIVEAMATETRAAASGPSLKKSSSYNEERSSKCGTGEAEEERRDERSVKGKCIPSGKWSVFKQQQQQPNK